jgi:hypothetical protein
VSRLSAEVTDADYERAAAALGCEVAAVCAVASVESSGDGFMAEGRPTILYEAHVYHRLTGGRFAAVRDRDGKPISVPTWDRSLYGAAGAHQWDRMRVAEACNRDAAWKACSWGAFQVLGENHLACGHATVEAFVKAVEGGAPAHLDAFVGFVRSAGLADELRRRDWAGFARGYNGPGYKTNAYDTKMAAAYRNHDSWS